MQHQADKTLNKKTPFFKKPGMAYQNFTAFLKWAPPGVWASICLMGAGQLVYGQIVKGIAFLSCLAASAWYFITMGIKDLAGIFTLGTRQEDLWLGIPGDNSMTMLILGVFAWGVLVLTVVLWYANVRDAVFSARRVQQGKKPRSFRQTLRAMADDKFHITSLSLPVVTVTVLSIVPIVFMILIAFTNLGGDIVYPKLAGWSLDAWQKLVGVSKLGGTFQKIITWNVTWAVSTTLINFIFGLSLALLLNKKNVRYSKFWRAFPILAYAIPGFISMLGYRFMFSQSGPINSLLTDAGKDSIFFLTNDASAKWWARGIGLFVNAWIATPSIMLMASGILSNISADLYEASTLDGASSLQQFRKITFPFVLFATTPLLISQFVGNFNNFGIFFFMRNNVISNYGDYFLASDTDLLINWLYNLSVDNNYYSVGAAISLVIFAITSTLSLAVYMRSAAYKQEDRYQ
ncbi:MAG: sugar ABC transporter permease [Clostridia bacterium]|nr:sugar ABC transporter permease [Clostridia bacterium]